MGAKEPAEQVVRNIRRRTRRHAPAQPALHRQTLAIEQGPDRARRRPANARIATLQPGPHLHRTPTRMRPPNRQARARNLLRQRPHTPVRRPRAVRKPRNTVQPIARKPLVTDPTAHTEPTTGRGKRFLTRLNRHHKTHPFIHSTGLLPNHRQAPPRRSSDLLPMSPVQTVTYVSGLHHTPYLPAGATAACPGPLSVGAPVGRRSACQDVDTTHFHGIEQQRRSIIGGSGNDQYRTGQRVAVPQT